MPQTCPLSIHQGPGLTVQTYRFEKLYYQYTCQTQYLVYSFCSSQILIHSIHHIPIYEFSWTYFQNQL